MQGVIYSCSWKRVFFVFLCLFIELLTLFEEFNVLRDLCINFIFLKLKLKTDQCRFTTEYKHTNCLLRSMMIKNASNQKTVGPLTNINTHLGAPWFPCPPGPQTSGGPILRSVLGQQLDPGTLS